MKNNNQTLKEMLIEDLDHGFVEELIAGTQSIYPDSYAAMTNDPDLGDEQAKSVLGHYRRGRIETLLQHVSAKHGLSQESVQPQGGGCSHISVHVGRFELVMCHVLSRDAFPQHSDDREQSSKVNECLSQLSLIDEPVTTPDEGELYGVIVHSEISGNKDKFGSIKIGFPNHEWDGWAEEPVCLLEISEIQSMQYQKQQDSPSQTQKDEPKWKTNENTNKTINDKEE